MEVCFFNVIERKYIKTMGNKTILINDNFKVLAYLYDIKDEGNLAYVEQQDIADIMSLSVVAVHHVLNVLKEECYLAQDLIHAGRYLLTRKAISAIETFRAIVA